MIKKLVISCIVYLSLLKEALKQLPNFEPDIWTKLEFFTSHGGQIKYFKSWNRILQDLLIYLGSLKVITTGQIPLLKMFEKIIL